MEEELKRLRRQVESLVAANAALEQKLIESEEQLVEAQESLARYEAADEYGD